MKYIYKDTDESRTLTATEFLRKHGLHVTEPRIAVVEDLMNNRTHATADEIYNRLIQVHHGLSCFGVQCAELVGRAPLYSGYYHR